MKTILSLCAICALCGSAFAQTPQVDHGAGAVVLGNGQIEAATPPTPATTPTAGTFFDSVTSYFTSFNPELESTFDAKGTFWTGADSIQGGQVPLANSVGLSYSIYKSISGEVVIRNSGVAGTLVSGQGGLSLRFKVHDALLLPYADAGYAFNGIRNEKLYGEIGVRACKALTTHTYAGVGIGAQLPANRQVFQVFGGFTF